jgi:transposase-like protein
MIVDRPPTSIRTEISTFNEWEERSMPRCPLCGSTGKEMEYDCDFSFSEIKSFICQHCGTSFNARSDEEDVTTAGRDKT